MADTHFSPGTASNPVRQPDEGADLDLELIELLFFAYRDFVGEADQTLSAFGFGRAHHRVLHFVSRNPGMRVTDLLDILRITKQSLGRVLKQLIDDGYVDQTPGPVDRRERLLTVTDKGRRLVLALAARQDARIAHALDSMPDGSRKVVRDFLSNMIDTAGHIPTSDTED